MKAFFLSCSFVFKGYWGGTKHYQLLRTELPSLPNACVEALSHNVTVFGDRTFKKVIKVK